jgi:hypothetical protein
MHFYIQTELENFLIEELSKSNRKNKIDIVYNHFDKAVEKIAKKYNEEYFRKTFPESYENMVSYKGYFPLNHCIDSWYTDWCPLLGSTLITLEGLVEVLKKNLRGIDYNVLRSLKKSS